MAIYTDHIGHRIELHGAPQRIVSLVPSQTEYLYLLGLSDRIVGITKFCVHPAAARENKTLIGGTKRLHMDRIRDLRPDLIVANKEENNQDDIEQLQREFNVWTSDIVTIDDSYDMMRSLAQMTDRHKHSEAIIEAIQRAMAEIPRGVAEPALYFIWDKPLMVAGSHTFIDKMMEAAGFENSAKAMEDQRYPAIAEEEIRNSPAKWLLLSSEPFPFRAEHQAKMQALFPEKKVILVDGEMFSWYGSRMALAAKYFKELQITQIQHITKA